MVDDYIAEFDHPDPTAFICDIETIPDVAVSLPSDRSSHLSSFLFSLGFLLANLSREDGK